MIDEESSKRITALRFLLIVFVVFLHVTPDSARFEIAEPLVFVWIKSAFLAICNSAVPLFFLFAGYLQFSKNDAYAVLLKKRVKSLLVPYILWTLICFCFYLVLQALPQFSSYLKSEDVIRNWRGIDYLNAFFYHNPTESLHQPLVGQYWFVRELMILIVVSPILTLLARKMKDAVLLFIVANYIIGFPLGFLVSTLSLFFYMAGFYFAEYKISFFALADKIKWKEYALLFMLIMVAKIKTQIHFHGLDTILSCLIMLKLSKQIVNSEKFWKCAKYLAGFSFFLYSIHWPFIVNPLKAVCLKLIPTYSIYSVAQFIVPGVLCVAIGTGLGIALKRIFPPLFALLNGGR